MKKKFRKKLLRLLYKNRELGVERLTQLLLDEVLIMNIITHGDDRIKGFSRTMGHLLTIAHDKYGLVVKFPEPDAKEKPSIH